jgi:hypothetical protein
MNSQDLTSFHLHSTFVENDLLKATNIYSVNDKKANLFENKLFAESILKQRKDLHK